MLEGGWITLCSFLISSLEALGDEIKSWLAALVASVSIALVLAFVSLSVTCTDDCGKALDVTVVGAPDVCITGVGLLLIKLSTKADVTLGCIVDVNVFARGGTIGINGIGCGGLIVWDGAIVGTLVAGVNGSAVVVIWVSNKGCAGF